MQLEQLETKSDGRGTLVEAFRFPNDGQLFYVVAKPNETRGNHFHEHKTEKFLVVYGSAVVSVKDRSSGNVMNVEVNGTAPIVVTIAPNNTHSITANPVGCIFIVWCDELYDASNPDTFPEEL